MEMIALDPNGPSYTTRSYDPDGTFSDFSCDLDGKTFRLTGEVQRFKGKFSDDGKTLSGQWVRRADGNWSPLMNVTLRKR